LDGALRAATFIETTTRDNTNVPPGGYFFGNGQSNKSTEHNIDVYALFTMLAHLSGDNSWLLIGSKPTWRLPTRHLRSITDGDRLAVYVCACPA
jgi:hypothetical protein